MRAPHHLTETEITQSLKELEAKIKVLQARSNATTSDANNTYQEHIAALQAKHALIAGKLTDTSSATDTTWQEIKSGLDDLTDGIKKIF